MTSTRIRGIYSTALTYYLDEQTTIDIVDPSPTIADRMNADYSVAQADITITADDDRQGIQISGSSTDLDAVTESITDIEIDAFSFSDPTPKAGIYQGTVTDTIGAGAILTLDENATGYLPYNAVDAYIEEGDTYTVQIRSPSPPWNTQDPRLSTQLTVPGHLFTLIRNKTSNIVEVPEESSPEEYDRMIDLLSIDVPPNWGISWHILADEISLDALEKALEAQLEICRTIEETMTSQGSELEGNHEILKPYRTNWIWFGRQARFLLDDFRNEVTHTLPGHHRVKAISETASQAIDFAEGIQAEIETFPFDVIISQFGPQQGDVVTIHHGKPNGSFISLGQGIVTDYSSENRKITVKRSISGGGTYDALNVKREKGDKAITKFKENRWWYPTAYYSDEGDLRGTYINISTPVELYPNRIQYMDLYIDVIKHADGTVEIVDNDELQEAVESDLVPVEIAEEAESLATKLKTKLGES
ncbi:MAG: DUF402 domain-containing protein [Halobacteriaceae archaeon]